MPTAMVVSQTLFCCVLSRSPPNSFSIPNEPPPETSPFYAACSPPSLSSASSHLATVRLFQENSTFVVYITNLAVNDWQDVFTLDVLEVPQGSGSGFVWDKDGNIMTNYHVIRGASDLKVTLADQSTYDAQVMGFNQDKDVAELHVDAPKEKLWPIPIVWTGSYTYHWCHQSAWKRNQFCCDRLP